jgi:hypothetical protein
MNALGKATPFNMKTAKHNESSQCKEFKKTKEYGLSLSMAPQYKPFPILDSVLIIYPE